MVAHRRQDLLQEGQPAQDAFADDGMLLIAPLFMRGPASIADLHT